MTSGVRKPDRVVARTQEEWKSLWRRHTPGNGVPPRVDFSREMVLAAFAGSRPTGGYSLRITRLSEESGKLVVEVTERKPPPGAITTQALTAPFSIVAVKKSTLPVKWLTRGN